VRRAAAAVLLALVGCTSERPPAVPSPSQAEWNRAHAELAALRARAPSTPYTARVAVTLHAYGQTLEGRGAIAVLPGQALRMIVVGPAGATAFDLWMNEEAWRIEVPAASMVRRGGAKDTAPGLPTGFFRTWFLDPLGGRLLASAGSKLVLRDRVGGMWVLDVTRGDTLHVAAVRKSSEGLQMLDFVGAPSSPLAGDRARWSDPAAGLAVEVQIEDVAKEPPDAEAFVEPKGPS
jgi:hypothetical protein